MDFVVLLKFRSSVSAAEADAGLGRRAAWKYPEGVQVIAEYWPLSSAVQVVASCPRTVSRRSWRSSSSGRTYSISTSTPLSRPRGAEDWV